MALGTHTGRSALGIAMGRSALGVRMAGKARMMAYVAQDKQTIAILLADTGSLYRTIPITAAAAAVGEIEPSHASMLHASGAMAWDASLNLYVGYQVGDSYSSSALAYLAKYNVSGILLWVAAAGSCAHIWKLMDAPVVLHSGDVIFADTIFSPSGVMQTSFDLLDPAVDGASDVISLGGLNGFVHRNDVSSYPVTRTNTGDFDYPGDHSNYLGGPTPVHANGWIALPYATDSGGATPAWSTTAGLALIRSDFSETSRNSARTLSGSDDNRKIFMLNTRCFPFADGWIAGFEFHSSFANVFTDAMVFFNPETNSEKEEVTLSMPIVNDGGDMVIVENEMFYVTMANSGTVTAGKSTLEKSGDFGVTASTIWSKPMTGSLPAPALNINARIAVSARF